MSDQAKPQGSLREVMPDTAAIVDELRAVFGKEFADKLVLDGKMGRLRFKSVEIGPDGVERTFGSFHHNTRWPGNGA